MTTLRARDRNINGRYVSAGMVEDDYSEDSWPDWRHADGDYGRSPFAPRRGGYGRSPFSPRRGGEDGPVIVYRAGEEPER